jgi:outer membrane protein TolC
LLQAWTISFVAVMLFGTVPPFAGKSEAISAPVGHAEEGVVGNHSVSADRPVTLNDCVRLALEHNPNLNVAKKEQSVQALEKPLAFSAFLPTLDAEGTYTRFGEKQRLVPAHANNDLGVFDEDFFEAGLVLRLPIFQGGKQVAAYRIAELAGKLASEQLVTTEQDLVLNVASFFFKTLQLDEVIQAAEASKEALESQTATTKLRLEVGRSAPLDSMKIEVRLASIVVHNSIFLIDFIKQARQDGMEREEALIQSVRLRLRPVLMTTISTFVGMLPIIFETAIGLERMSPLASAAGFGL